MKIEGLTTDELNFSPIQTNRTLIAAVLYMVISMLAISTVSAQSTADWKRAKSQQSHNHVSIKSTLTSPLAKERSMPMLPFVLAIAEHRIDHIISQYYDGESETYENEERTIITYDEHGNVAYLEISFFDYESNSWEEPYFRYQYSFSESGRMDSMHTEYFEPEFGQWIADEEFKTLLYYSANGNLDYIDDYYGDEIFRTDFNYTNDFPSTIIYSEGFVSDDPSWELVYKDTLYADGDDLVFLEFTYDSTTANWAGPDYRGTVYDTDFKKLLEISGWGPSQYLTFVFPDFLYEYLDEEDTWQPDERQISTKNGDQITAQVYQYYEPEVEEWITSDSLALLYRDGMLSEVVEAYGYDEGEFYDYYRSLIYYTPSTSITEIGTAPRTFELEQNYPNPFNPSSTIRYSLPKAANVRLDIFTLLGQTVATLVDVRQPAGNYSVLFDAAGLSSGTYVYRLSADGFVATRKMTLIE